MELEHPSLNSTNGHDPVLRSVHAHGRLEGLLLTMSLRQVFINDGNENLEVSYTFPLAWGAVLIGLSVTLAGRQMRGRVMARQEARDAYEEAVQDGDAPVMVEQVRAGMFNASLGSLKPGEEAVIELQYAQLLDFEQGRVRLVVPTTIAPRFGDAEAEGELRPDQAASPSVLAEHRFALELNLVGPVASARIGSPTHAVNQRRTDEGVAVTLQHAAWLDRDFVLQLDELAMRTLAVAGPDKISGEGHAAVLLSCCPTLPESAPASLRVKILVDCSGSMAGDSLEQAKDALRALALRLSPRDRVAFSRFGSQPQRVLPSAAANPKHVRQLMADIEATEADLGGTEMADALNDTFALVMDDSAPGDESDVLLITDGEVWGAETLLNAARRSGHRIHALGVGSAPAESLLRELSEATGGSCEFVTPHEDMVQATQRLLARMRTAQTVHTELQAADPVLWHSPLPQRISASETVHLHLRLGTKPVHAPSMSINDIAAEEAHLIKRSDDLVARLVAAREIAGMHDAQQATVLAEKYQLVSQHTNLLLVIDRVGEEKTDGMPSLQAVQPMLAAGWGGTGRVMTTERLSVYGDASSLLNLACHFDETPKVDLRSRQFMEADRDTSFSIPLESHEQDTEELDQALNEAMGDQVIAAFNAAVASGQGYRQALRAVTSLPFAEFLTNRFKRLGRGAGGALKAWAVYLLWLHDEGSQSERLTHDALKQVQAQLSSLDPTARTQLHALVQDRLAHRIAPNSLVDSL